MRKRIKDYLQSPYWVIDILPRQVSKESGGQYFEVEDYFLHGDRFDAVKEKQIHIVLKLNCYYPLSLDQEDVVNPSPDHVAEMMRKRDVSILIGDALIVSSLDALHLTVYHTDEKMLELVRSIACSEGMFVWKPAGY